MGEENEWRLSDNLAVQALRRVEDLSTPACLFMSTEMEGDVLAKRKKEMIVGQGV